MSKIDHLGVDWRPKWEGEDLEQFRSLYSAFSSQVTSFRDLRLALGLSQAEAANRLSTSQSNISKIEAKSDPSISTLKQLVGDKGSLTIVAHLENGKEVAINFER